jgi:hypothetical protein
MLTVEFTPAAEKQVSQLNLDVSLQQFLLGKIRMPNHMANEFIRAYANLARKYIDNNSMFLESKSGDPLLKEMREFVESWNKAEEIVSDVLKWGYSTRNFRSSADYTWSMMDFVVSHVWFPSLFSVMTDILVGTLDSVCRTIRFLLEGLELGLVLDCSKEFRRLNLIEKWERIKESGFRPYRLKRYIEKLLQKDVIEELEKFYSELSSEWMHTPSYVDKLLEDIFREGDLPAKILYFPPLEERKEDVNKLVGILNRFNKYALILVKEWERRLRKGKV